MALIFLMDAGMAYSVTICAVYAAAGVFTCRYHRRHWVACRGHQLLRSVLAWQVLAGFTLNAAVTVGWPEDQHNTPHGIVATVLGQMLLLFGVGLGSLAVDACNASHPEGRLTIGLMSFFCVLQIVGNMSGAWQDSAVFDGFWMDDANGTSVRVGVRRGVV